LRRIGALKDAEPEAPARVQRPQRRAPARQAAPFSPIN
jgi:hypothetical protein